MLHLKNPLFPQTERYVFRDPAACIENGVIHLFFTLVENVGGEQFLYVAESKSHDFMHWTKPLTDRFLSAKNRS